MKSKDDGKENEDEDKRMSNKERKLQNEKQDNCCRLVFQLYDQNIFENNCNDVSNSKNGVMLCYVDNAESRRDTSSSQYMKLLGQQNLLQNVLTILQLKNILSSVAKSRAKQSRTQHSTVK